MLTRRNSLTAFLSVLLLLAFTSNASAQQWEVQLPVRHRAQQENWSCGPNTIAMWAGYLKNASYNTNSIADNYTGGRGDGTSIPEFANAMHQLTKPYKYAEWEYSWPQAAIKGVMYTVARYNQPVAISGNNGGHYYLVVGGVASKNPFVYYGKDSSIKYLYLLDSRENSPLYTNPKAFSSAWWSISSYPIFKKGQRYTPEAVMLRWTRVPLWNPKFRAVERVPDSRTQGATYRNGDYFLSY